MLYSTGGKQKKIDKQCIISTFKINKLTIPKSLIYAHGNVTLHID